jgi:hypothetical protein
MKTDAEIRLTGMRALIDALGLVEAEQFMVAVSQDRFNYTEWRRNHLPAVSLEELAQAADAFSARCDAGIP